jgi:hypothetical protein
MSRTDGSCGGEAAPLGLSMDINPRIIHLWTGTQQAGTRVKVRKCPLATVRKTGIGEYLRLHVIAQQNQAQNINWSKTGQFSNSR